MRRVDIDEYNLSMANAKINNCMNIYIIKYDIFFKFVDVVDHRLAHCNTVDCRTEVTQWTRCE